MATQAHANRKTKELHDLALHFYALKDALRLEMLLQLAGHECTVNELAAQLHKSQPLISWHLRRLKTAGIVKIRRAGREVYCSLDRDALAEQQQIFSNLVKI